VTVITIDGDNSHAIKDLLAVEDTLPVLDEGLRRHAGTQLPQSTTNEDTTHSTSTNLETGGQINTHQRGKDWLRTTASLHGLGHQVQSVLAK